MPERIPTVGGDLDVWGGVLAGWLRVAHEDDGTPKTTDAVLVEWTEGEAWEPSGTISRDANGVVTTCGVAWPDGGVGVFTTTDNDPDSGAIDAYTVTHVGKGKTVTQAAVTRAADGSVSVKPALTVT